MRSLFRNQSRWGFGAGRTSLHLGPRLGTRFGLAQSKLAPDPSPPRKRWVFREPRPTKTAAQPTKKTAPSYRSRQSIDAVNTQRITIDYAIFRRQAKLALKNKSCQSQLQCQSEKRPLVIPRTRLGPSPRTPDFARGKNSQLIDPKAMPGEPVPP
jgi:hypothetical protein